MRSAIEYTLEFLAIQIGEAPFFGRQMSADIANRIWGLRLNWRFIPDCNFNILAQYTVAQASPIIRRQHGRRRLHFVWYLVPIMFVHYRF
jgi:hypothetical protein